MKLDFEFLILSLLLIQLAQFHTFHDLYPKLEEALAGKVAVAGYYHHHDRVHQKLDLVVYYWGGTILGGFGPEGSEGIVGAEGAGC